MLINDNVESHHFLLLYFQRHLFPTKLNVFFTKVTNNIKDNHFSFIYTGWPDLIFWFPFIHNYCVYCPSNSANILVFGNLSVTKTSVSKRTRFPWKHVFFSCCHYEVSLYLILMFHFAFYSSKSLTLLYSDYWKHKWLIKGCN